MLSRNILRIAVIFVGIATCVVSFRWSQAGVIATVLLLYITLEYVLTTRDNLDLFRHQLERQERVFIYFDLVAKAGVLYVRVSNLGTSNFLVTGVNVRTQDMATFNYSFHQVVESGKSEELPLPQEVCANYPLSVDLEVALDCVGQDVRSKTVPQCFNVSMGLENIPDKASLGLNGLWPAVCPNCGFGGMLFMSMRNLTTFAGVAARKQQLLVDLNNSCPNHSSPLLFSMNDVNAHDGH